MLPLLLLSACAPEPAPPTTQPPLLAWLVVHVDPLPRRADGPCADPDLSSCGTLDAGAWVERTENLGWLAERWVERGRTMDLELGPEAALGWAEDEAVLGALTDGLAGEGAADPEGLARETALSGRTSVAALVSAGAASLGVHVHEVLPDDDGRWGAVALEQEGEGATTEACAAWEGAPLVEPDPALAERVVAYGVEAADAVAAPLGEPLLSFTGHLPRAMSSKIAVVEDPEALDPEAEAGFSERFQPGSLGSAYSECLSVAVDHPPLESWPADPERALGAGEGPPVIPGVGVVGSMAEHLGAPNDGSLGAQARRLLLALVNWRYQGLLASAPRPWVFTFHAHLFDLYAGSPNARISAERELRPQEGQKYRGELDGLSGLIDGFAGRTRWAGLEAPSGVARWALPAELDASGSQFSYAREGEAPPEGLDTELYPYLPLLAERLADTHLICSGSSEEVEIYGLLRCSKGWAWAGEQDGYHCAEGEEPAWVYLLIPEGPTCLDAPSESALSAPVDALELAPAERCGSGLEVPLQGLLVEPAAGPWWSERCAPWG